jgi:hypothetical protein
VIELLEDSIARFLEVHGAEDFPHSEELKLRRRTMPDQLHWDPWHETPIPFSHFATVYGDRAKLVRSQSGKNDPLYAEFATMYKAFIKARRQNCRFWLCVFQDGVSFAVFENSRRPGPKLPNKSLNRTRPQRPVWFLLRFVPPCQLARSVRRLICFPVAKRNRNIFLSSVFLSFS